jgi:small multidrug resistance pump
VITNFILLTAIALEVTGTMCLTMSQGFAVKRWVGPFVLAYVLSLVLFAVVLRRGLPVGVAYGVWTAAGVALTAILGRLLFSEPLTKLMGGGIVAIMAGVLTVELNSH